MTSWPLVSLADVASPEKRSIISGPFGSNIGKRFFRPSGVPVIRGNNLANTDAKFTDEGFVFLSEEKSASLNCWAYPDDLVFTAAGSLGQVGLIPRDGRYSRYVISNKQLRITLDEAKIVPAFAYYHFSSQEMRAFIKAQNRGSSVPLITLGVLKSLPIPQPPIATQHRIASILSAYDELIENNTRRIKILEEMAQSIYKEWFVNFRYPGHENVPLVDSELGPIPEGWTVQPIHAIGDVITGATPSSKAIEMWGDSVPFITPTDLDYGRPWAAPVRGISEFGAQKFRSRIVGRGAICFTCIASIGKMCVVGTPSLTNQQINTVIPHRIEDSLFVYHHLHHSVPRIQGMASGVATPIINKSMFSTIPTMSPDFELRRRFGAQVTAIHELGTSLENSNATLRRMRGLLLPRLISGEIDVSELDRYK